MACKLVNQLRLAEFFAVILILFFTTGCVFAEEEKDLSFNLVDTGKGGAEIIVSSDASEIVKNAALTLQKVVLQRTNVKLNIVEAGSERSDSGGIYLFTTEGSDFKEAIKAFGYEPVTTLKPGKEGFRIVSGLGKEGRAIIVNGCDDLGVFHGVGWLLRKVDFTDSKAVIANNLDIMTAPATSMRYIRFGDHYGYVNADLDGWREIWNDYIMWGLSAAVFRCDPAHQGDPRESVIAKLLWDKWAMRVPIARSLGLEVIHLTQTNLTFKDGEFGPQQVPNFKELNEYCRDYPGVNPKTQRGRDLLYNSRKWFFDNMPHIESVNYFLTSGWDNGGCL